jgi:catechol 2,3-dioxygenase-like lactoylglutathione lyase family enzyme
MAVKRMDHIGVVVDDLDAAVAFFVELGLKLADRASVAGEWVDRVTGLEGVHADIAFLRARGGETALELTMNHSPAGEPAGRGEPANALGLRHLTFLVDDLDETLARLRSHGAELVGTVEQYEDAYRLCYVRGPARIIIELAQQLG